MIARFLNAARSAWRVQAARLCMSEFGLVSTLRASAGGTMEIRRGPTRDHRAGVPIIRKTCGMVL
jgi:hypothetical protein